MGRGLVPIAFAALMVACGTETYHADDCRNLDSEFGVMSVIHIDPVDTHDREAGLLQKRVLKKIRAMDPAAGTITFRKED